MADGTTIITCVESGPLEAQVLMLAESLRAFGGAWRNVDFVAVKPRRGPRISSMTRREFRRLGVEFIDEKFNVALEWWNNANKSAVMAQLEARVSTPYITWMDGDMIVLQELDNLLPAVGADFVARAGEGYLGSDGRDVNALYWKKLCWYIGIDFDMFDLIYSSPERRQIRAYWQAGLYTYAASTRLGRAHFESISDLFSSKIASKTAGIYHQDQVSLALAVQRLELSSSEYAWRMNCHLNPLEKDSGTLLPMPEVKVLHYHHSLYREASEWAMGFINRLAPDRVELIRKYVPLTANADLHARLIKRLLRATRNRKVNRFAAQAIPF
jgi:hypothetical protein